MSFVANAQALTMQKYLHPKDETERLIFKMYLRGAAEALLAYNVTTTDKQYCQPKNFALTTEQANDIVQRWAKTQTIKIEEFLVALALLYGLQETFPCPK